MELIEGAVQVANSGWGAAGAGFAAGALAKAKTTRDVLSLIRDSQGLVRSYASRRRNIRHAREVLGLVHSGDTTYRHDSLHPLYHSGEMHPDNLRALVVTSGPDVLEAERAQTLQIQQRVRGDLRGNLVLIGSPTSEGLSRVLFGYQARDGHADELVIRHSPVDFPYRMVLDKGQVASRAKRFVPGRGVVSRPNWRFVSEERVFVPATRDEWLNDDFLLVTRVRNYLSAQALDSGKFVVSFSGAHGTGTRAVELLLRDDAAIRELAEVLDGRVDRSFQALFAVSSLKHDPTRGTRATALELVERPKLLPDSDEAWRTARAYTQPRVQRWLEGTGPESR